MFPQAVGRLFLMIGAFAGKIFSTLANHKNEIKKQQGEIVLHEKRLMEFSLGFMSGKLTPEEYDVIKQPPEMGRRILNDTGIERN
jgi:hypothetical protein